MIAKAPGFANPQWDGELTRENYGLECDYCGEPLGTHTQGTASCRRAPIRKTPPQGGIKHDAGSPLDVQVGGDHYKKFGDFQPWQVLHKWLTPEELKGFMKGTVITYLAREADKDGRVGVEKASHTLQIYLELTKDDHVNQQKEKGDSPSPA